MWVTILFCFPGALSQAIFSLGLTAGDASQGGYQPLLPQTATYVQPYSPGVVPVGGYPSYPMGAGYPSSMGVGYPMNYGMPYGTYPQIYEIHRPEGAMRRFWKGAADGVVQGSLGWLG